MFEHLLYCSSVSEVRGQMRKCPSLCLWEAIWLLKLHLALEQHGVWGSNTPLTLQLRKFTQDF